MVAALVLVWNILVQVEVLYFDHTADKVSILLELDYCIMISGVAILWRPMADRDAAYDMEVPGCDDYELELREDIVPAHAWEQDNHEDDDSNVAESAYVSPMESLAPGSSTGGGVLS